MYKFVTTKQFNTVAIGEMQLDKKKKKKTFAHSHWMDGIFYYVMFTLHAVIDTEIHLADVTWTSGFTYAYG